MIEFRLNRNIDNFTDTADEIGFYVQAHGGEIHVHKNYITFAVPIKEFTFLALKYSQLEMEAYVW
jgi:hypothetical protein